MINTEVDMTRDAGNLFQTHAQKMHGLFVEDGLVKLHHSVGEPSQPISGWTEEETRRA